ncbi:MAG: S1 RNA-binding domain-containing protein [Methanobacteriota archaeon]|nr:MAG: S1 RNA-binding domain-containing protein [Euryarchaeota archaeon]
MINLDAVQKIKKGDIVVVNITRVMRYGAISTIEGHSDIEGFMHISEISSKWIKNIGDYVRKGQRLVAKVLDYDDKKKVATLSLRRVTEDERKKALDLFNNILKSKKILQTAIKKAKSRSKFENIEAKILKDYENLHDFMLDVFDEGIEVAEEEGLPKAVSEVLVELVKKSFKKSRVSIRKLLYVELRAPNGIELIKEVLSKVGKSISVKYLGAPRYLLEAEAEDYKKANKMFNSISPAIKELSKHGIVEISDYED